MVFDAGGPLTFNCRYTSFLIVVHQVLLRDTLLSISCRKPDFQQTMILRVSVLVSIYGRNCIWSLRKEFLIHFQTPWGVPLIR